MILLGGMPAGWIRADGMGVVEALEIVPRLRGKELAVRVLQEYCGGRTFVALMPNAAALRALRRAASVQETEPGLYRIIVDEAGRSEADP